MVLPLFALLFLSTFAHASYILFYAGDLDTPDTNANALANGNDAIVGAIPNARQHRANRYDHQS